MGQDSWKGIGITGTRDEAGKKGDTWGSHVLELANGGGLQGSREVVSGGAQKLLRPGE